MRPVENYSLFISFCAWDSLILARGFRGAGVTVPKKSEGFTTYERRFLASLIHQVWRACQGFVAIVVERGPAEAVYALEDLAEWSLAQSARLRASSRRPQTIGGAARPQTVGTAARRAAGDLLTDVGTFCTGIGDLLGNAQQSPLDPDEVEDDALMMIEGFLGWTTLMAGQLGIARNLRPQTLWHER